MSKAKPKVFKKGGKQRNGKGFSQEELKKAGSSLKEALRLHIPVDSRRRSAHEENVKLAKSFLEAKKASSKPKRKPKPKRKSKS
jgi:ribosomal protein L13E